MKRGRIKVAVVGCGRISGAHIKAYLNNPYCELAGLADLEAARASSAGKAYGVNWYSGEDELFEKENPFAISVCTPPGAHGETVRKAAGRGIHVLCEKPLSTNSPSAEEMVAAAERNGIIFLVANCHKFQPEVSGLRKKLDDGKLGKVTSYRNRFNWGRKTAAEARLRAGALLDNGIHSIYLFRHLCGEVKKVSAFFPEETKDILEILQVYAILESFSGALGVIEVDSFCSTAALTANIIEVFTEGGSGLVNYGGRSYYMTEKTGRRIPLAAGKAAAGRIEGEINHFINCLRGREEPLIEAAGGVADIKIAEKIYESGVKGRAIPVNL